MKTERDFGVVACGYANEYGEEIHCTVLCIPNKYQPIPSRSVEGGYIENGVFHTRGPKRRTHWCYAFKDGSLDRDPFPGEIQTISSFLVMDDYSVGTINGFPAVTARYKNGHISYDWEERNEAGNT